MYLNIKAFKTHKIGENFESCHDNYQYDLEKKLFAVADGVSKSFFPDIWSKLLVEKFIKDSSILDDVDIEKWLNSPRKKWSNEISKNDWNNLPFYVKNRRNQPAFSTLIGVQLSIDKNDSYSWKATVIGDSCLFHIREEEIIAVYNIDKSSKFDNFPDSISSNKITTENYIDNFQKKVRRHSGTLELNDKLILATDAVSKWILENYENKRAADNEKLYETKKMPEFDELIYKAKMGEYTSRMEDDDATFVLISADEVKKDLVELPEGWESKYSKKNWSGKLDIKPIEKTKNMASLEQKINKEMSESLNNLSTSIRNLKIDIEEHIRSVFSNVSHKLDDVVKLLGNNIEEQQSNKEEVIKQIQKIEKEIEQNKKEFGQKISGIQEELTIQLKQNGEKVLDAMANHLKKISEQINDNDENLKKKITEFSDQFKDYYIKELEEQKNTITELNDYHEQLRLEKDNLHTENIKIKAVNKVYYRLNIGLFVLVCLSMAFFIYKIFFTD